MVGTLGPGQKERFLSLTGEAVSRRRATVAGTDYIPHTWRSLSFEMVNIYFRISHSTDNIQRVQSNVNELWERVLFHSFGFIEN